MLRLRKSLLFFALPFQTRMGNVAFGSFNTSAAVEQERTWDSTFTFWRHLIEIRMFRLPILSLSGWSDTVTSVTGLVFPSFVFRLSYCDYYYSCRWILVMIYPTRLIH